MANTVMKLYEDHNYGGRLKVRSCKYSIKFANEHGLKSFITSAKVNHSIIHISRL